MEKDDAPGTARFGNFINYYNFNPPFRRINMLPEMIFSDIFGKSPKETLHLLDLGCNAGNLTKSFYGLLQDSQKTAEKTSTIKVLGVDLDKQLIARCVETADYPTKDIQFQTVDIMTQEGRVIIGEYMSANGIAAFDLISCFSLTLWIHLNHGDDGIKDFLSYVSCICDNLLLEPQPWKCYRNAARRMQKDDCSPFEHYKTLTWRSNVVENIENFLVKESGFKLKTKFGVTDQWERRICLFSKMD